MSTKNGFGLETADAGGSDATASLDEATKIVVAHLVARETAELTAKNETLAGELAKTKDALEIANKTIADKDAEFEGFKNEIAAKAEHAELVKARTAKVAEALPTLEITEERAARWASMAEVDFESYLQDVAAAAGVSQASKTESFDSAKGETAMDRSRKSTTDKSAGRTVLGL